MGAQEKQASESGAPVQACGCFKAASDVTESVAELLTTEYPQADVTIQRYFIPSILRSALTDIAADVLPFTFIHDTPFRLDCHWYLTFLPEAFAVKLAVAPGATVLFVGCEVISTAAVVLLVTVLCIFLSVTTAFIISFGIIVSPPRVTELDTELSDFPAGAAAYFAANFVFSFETSSIGALSFIARGPPQRPSGKFSPYVIRTVAGLEKNLFATR